MPKNEAQAEPIQEVEAPKPEAPAPTAPKEPEKPTAARNQEFIDKLMAARAKNTAEAKAPTPQPVAARITEQTKRELEAGKKTVAKHEQQKALNPRPAPDPTREGKVVPVFRPKDYVPNFKQGNIKATPVGE